MNSFYNKNILQETDKDLIIKNQEDVDKLTNSFKLLNKENFLIINYTQRNYEIINIFKKFLKYFQII